MRLTIASLLTLTVLLSACGLLPTQATLTPVPPTPAPATLPPTPTLAPTVTATRVVPPVAPTILPTPSEPVPLTFNAADGAALAANYYPPIVRPAPALVLVHMLGGSKADWDSFARSLQSQGYAALAIDLRGFGSSPGPENWTKAPDDVKAAWQVLSARPEVDVNRTGLVGASIGANLSLMVGGPEERIVAVVALSPGLDYHGLNPTSAMSGFGQRPVYLVAGKDDTYSYNSVASLAGLSISAETLLPDNAGHGTDMFGRVPTLEQDLITWLNKYVRDLLKG